MAVSLNPRGISIPDGMARPVGGIAEPAKLAVGTKLIISRTDSLLRLTPDKLWVRLGSVGNGQSEWLVAKRGSVDARMAETLPRGYVAVSGPIVVDRESDLRRPPLPGISLVSQGTNVAGKQVWYMVRPTGLPPI